MARRFVNGADLNNKELRNALAQVLAVNPTGIEGKFIYHSGTDTFNFYNGAEWLTLGRLDQITAPTADVSLNNNKITDLAAPTNANDAARKVYVDDAIDTLETYIENLSQGLDWKEAVRAASVANVNTGSAPASMDGVTLTSGDRLLLKNQTAPEENGIYVYAGSGNAMARAADMDSAAELNGAIVAVLEGSANANTVWMQTADDITLDTDSVTWVAFGTSATTYTAGDGLSLDGNEFNVNPGQGIVIVSDAVAASLGEGLDFNGSDEIAVQVGDGLVIDGNAVAIDVPLDVTFGGTGATDASGARTNLGVVNALRYAETLGDGAATSFNVDHNLGTQDVVVQLRDTSNGEIVEADYTVVSNSRVTVAFADAPANGAYRVVVVG